MKKVILDTNFIIYCVQNKVDFFEELKRICDFKFELYIIDKTLDELDKLKQGKLAKIMLKKFKVKKIKSNKKSVDDKIIELCSDDVIVATHDKELIKKLSCKIVKVRQKKYLIIK